MAQHILPSNSESLKISLRIKRAHADLKLLAASNPTLAITVCDSITNNMKKFRP